MSSLNSPLSIGVTWTVTDERQYPYSLSEAVSIDIGYDPARRPSCGAE